MFTNDDVRQITGRGTTVQAVESQVERFKKGFPWIHGSRKSVIAEIEFHRIDVAGSDAARADNILQYEAVPKAIYYCIIAFSGSPATQHIGIIAAVEICPVIVVHVLQRSITSAILGNFAGFSTHDCIS